ncbi:hypothetical protein LguiB_011025 [Lonicera macranthoides]
MVRSRFLLLILGFLCNQQLQITNTVAPSMLGAWNLSISLRASSNLSDIKRDLRVDLMGSFFV